MVRSFLVCAHADDTGETVVPSASPVVILLFDCAVVATVVAVAASGDVVVFVSGSMRDNRAPTLILKISAPIVTFTLSGVSVVRW